MAYIAIHRAATYGDVDALRRELETNVSPDIQCPHGLVALHYVVAHAERHRQHGTENRVAIIHYSQPRERTCQWQLE